MGHRLSKIYTKTGDDGSTGLGDGSRTQKDDIRIHTYGTVDELNSMVGLLIVCDDMPAEFIESLSRIQHDLFDVGGELSIPEHVMLNETYVARLESWIDEQNAQLPPLKNFILPGGSKSAAVCHVARTICRRAERDAVTLARSVKVNEYSIKYLNRLSDYLFVLARSILRVLEKPEVLWQPPKK